MILELGRTAGPQVRSERKAVPDRGQHSLQAGAVDQEAAVLPRAAGRGAHEAPHAQVARASGAHHLGLPSHLRTPQGFELEQRSDGRRLQRGGLFSSQPFCNDSPKLTLI